VDSSIAYQSEGRELPSGAIEAINAFGTGGLVPDLTVLLDIDQAAATARREQTGLAADRLESAGDSFHQRVRRRYLELAAASPDRYAVVDAAATPQAVHEEIWTAIEGLMGAGGREPGGPDQPAMNRRSGGERS
jgi:dTMP kinase